MILHPPVLALLIGSLLASFMLIYATCYAIAILRNWDLASGSERQLALERKTYLISTLVNYTFAFQLLSLFLFVFLADDLSRLFVGAMCAAGTLNVNDYGYPALILKMINFLLAGIWLVVNYVDNQAYDYPLIRKKYQMLVVITPLMLIETGILIRYFLDLHPDIITSCCSTIFSPATSGAEGNWMVSSMGLSSPVVFFVLMGATLLLGLCVSAHPGQGAYVFALLSIITFVLSLAMLISFFSLYIYELPTHHCPFCLLQGEYHAVGYPLYLSLFGGLLAGVCVGVISPAKKIPSLTTIVLATQHRLALTSVGCYALFTSIIIITTMTSNLVIEG